MKNRLLRDAGISYGLYIDSNILVNGDGGGVLMDWDIGSEARMHGDWSDEFRGKHTTITPQILNY